MDRLEELIRQSIMWRSHYRERRMHIDACFAAIRAHALLDAYKILGGDTSPWRTDTGVLR